METIFFYVIIAALIVLCISVRNDICLVKKTSKRYEYAKKIFYVLHIEKVNISYIFSVSADQRERFAEMDREQQLAALIREDKSVNDAVQAGLKNAQNLIEFKKRMVDAPQAGTRNTQNPMDFTPPNGSDIRAELKAQKMSLSKYTRMENILISALERKIIIPKYIFFLEYKPPDGETSYKKRENVSIKELAELMDAISGTDIYGNIASDIGTYLKERTKEESKKQTVSIGKSGKDRKFPTAAKNDLKKYPSNEVELVKKTSRRYGFAKKVFDGLDIKKVDMSYNFSCSWNQNAQADKMDTDQQLTTIIYEDKSVNDAIRAGLKNAQNLIDFKKQMANAPQAGTKNTQNLMDFKSPNENEISQDLKVQHMGLFRYTEIEDSIISSLEEEIIIPKYSFSIEYKPQQWEIGHTKSEIVNIEKLAEIMDSIYETDEYRNVISDIGRYLKEQKSKQTLSSGKTNKNEKIPPISKNDLEEGTSRSPAAEKKNERYEYAKNVLRGMKIEKVNRSYTFSIPLNSKAQFDKFNLEHQLMTLLREDRSVKDAVEAGLKNRESKKIFREKMTHAPAYLNWSSFSRLLEDAKVSLIESSIIIPKYNFIFTYTSRKGENSYQREENVDIDKIAALMERRSSAQYQRSLMSQSLRYDIMRRDNFRCQICGRSAEDGVKLHVDHIKPVSKGGKTEWDNLRTLCQDCNLGKKDKFVQDGAN